MKFLFWGNASSSKELLSDRVLGLPYQGYLVHRCIQWCLTDFSGLSGKANCVSVSKIWRMLSRLKWNQSSFFLDHCSLSTGGSGLFKQQVIWNWMWWKHITVKDATNSNRELGCSFLLVVLCLSVYLVFSLKDVLISKKKKKIADRSKSLRFERTAERVGVLLACSCFIVPNSWYHLSLLNFVNHMEFTQLHVDHRPPGCR